MRKSKLTFLLQTYISISYITRIVPDSDLTYVGFPKVCLVTTVVSRDRWNQFLQTWEEVGETVTKLKLTTVAPPG
jgi:hypothetical protein